MISESASAGLRAEVTSFAARELGPYFQSASDGEGGAGIDSYAVLELAVALEQRFGIRVEDAELAAACQSVDAVIDLTVSKIRESNRRP